MDRHILQLSLIALAGTAAHAQQVRVIALTGTDGPLGPGLGPGAVFESFGTAIEDACLTVNQHGEVAFTADVIGSDFLGANLITDGVWLDRGLGPETVVLAGQQAFDTPGLIYGSFAQTARVFRDVLLNSNSDLSFTALLGNPDGSTLTSFSTDTGVWVVQTFDNTPRLAVREGDGINATPSAFVETINPPVMDDSPSVTFQTGYGFGPLHGLVRATPGGAVVSVLQTEDAVPDVPAAIFVGPFGDAFSQIRTAAAGLAFVGRFSGVGVTDPDNTGVFVSEPFFGRLIAREGSPAPDTDATFVQFDKLAATHAGTVGFIASLSGGTPSSAIFREPLPGELRAVAVQGEPALGVPGSVFAGFGPQTAFAMSEIGFVVFHAPTMQTSFPFTLSSGLWVAGDFPVLVAKPGDQPPGTPPGASFLEFGTVAAGSGKAAFTATWQPDQSSQPLSGVWGIAPGAQPVKLLAAGDTITVSPGDQRTVTGFEIVPDRGSGDGRAASMNADGWLIGVASFTDGQSAMLALRVPDQACPVDLAPPFGTLNFFDISAFLGLFNTQQPNADLAPPFGVWNFFDISAFLAAFSAGCP